MHTSVVFAGGPPPDPGVQQAYGRVLDGLGADLVVAADSGLHVAQDLGVKVDRVVGDMDSVDPARLEAAVAAGSVVDRHPTDKDLTDLELALDAARAAGSERIVVLAGPAGRLDHLVGGIGVLTAPSLAPVVVEAWLGRTRLTPVHGGQGGRRIAGPAGTTVSLVPMHGPAVGVATTGLKWALEGDTLAAGSGRGVSNEFSEDTAVVSVDAGCLAVIVPDPAGDR